MKSADHSSRKSQSETNAIHEEVLLARCMGSVSFAQVLLREFESTAESRLAELTRHATEGRYDELIEAAHALKGAAGILAAERLRSLAAEIESAGRSQDFERALSFVEDLHREMRRCLADVSRIRAQMAVGRS